MNFKGLVIGDCLEMDAISRLALEEAGVFALSDCRLVFLSPLLEDK